MNKVKTINQLSFTVDGIYVNISLIIKENGTLASRSHLRGTDFKDKKYIEYKKEYYLQHIEDFAIRAKRAKKIPKEKANEASRKAYRKNPEYYNAKSDKRKRELGRIPLNSKASGDVFHHISRLYGVYIPAKIHRSISHNLKTGKNMEIINELAFGYLLPIGR